VTKIKAKWLVSTINYKTILEFIFYTLLFIFIFRTTW